MRPLTRAEDSALFWNSIRLMDTWARWQFWGHSSDENYHIYHKWADDPKRGRFPALFIQDYPKMAVSA